MSIVMQIKSQACSASDLSIYNWSHSVINYLTIHATELFYFASNTLKLDKNATDPFRFYQLSPLVDETLPIYLA